MMPSKISLNNMAFTHPTNNRYPYDCEQIILSLYLLRFSDGTTDEIVAWPVDHLINRSTQRV